MNKSESATSLSESRNSFSVKCDSARGVRQRASSSVRHSQSERMLTVIAVDTTSVFSATTQRDRVTVRHSGPRHSQIRKYWHTARDIRRHWQTFGDTAGHWQAPRDTGRHWQILVRHVETHPSILLYCTDAATLVLQHVVGKWISVRKCPLIWYM